MGESPASARNSKRALEKAKQEEEARAKDPIKVPLPQTPIKSEPDGKHDGKPDGIPIHDILRYKPRKKEKPDWAATFKVQPHKNLTSLEGETTKEYRAWAHKFHTVMALMEVPLSYYSDDVENYKIPTRTVWDVEENCPFEEPLVSTETEMLLYALLISNLGEFWSEEIRLGGATDFRSSWFMVRKRFDSDTRKSRRKKKEEFFKLQMTDGYTNFAGQVREKGKQLNRLLRRPCCLFLMDGDFIGALFSGLENIEEFKVQIAMLERSMNEGKEYNFNQIVDDLGLTALDMVDAHGNTA
jgi:hypothetical protein